MRIKKIETTVIPNTEHGRKYADEYCGKLRVQGALIGRVTKTDNIIVDAEYYMNVREPAEYKCKCWSCKWLDKDRKKSIGYPCTNPEKEWRSSLGMYKQKSNPACSKYEEGDKNEAHD